MQVKVMLSMGLLNAKQLLNNFHSMLQQQQQQQLRFLLT